MPAPTDQKAAGPQPLDKPRKRPNKSKSAVPMRTDVVDTWDPTGGLFGAGGSTSFHHSGPYDAAAKNRNEHSTGKRRTLAPIGAFDPSALDPSKAFLRNPTSAPPMPSGGFSGGAYPALNSGGASGGGLAARGGGARGGAGGDGISQRAKATLAAMDDTDAKFLGNTKSSPYSVLPNTSETASMPSLHESSPGITPPGTPGGSLYANGSGNLSNLRNGAGTNRSTHSIYMGFPAGGPDGDVSKAAQVMQAWGIRDQEAWEDFGRVHGSSSNATGSGGRERRARRTRGDGAGGAADGTSALNPTSAAATRVAMRNGGSGLRRAGTLSGMSKEERAMRVGSVWDMEATLEAGKPVHITSQAPPVPALPAVPASPHHRSFSASPRSTMAPLGPGPNGGSIKRSKSLIQKLRKASKNPNAPLSEEDEPTSPVTSPTKYPTEDPMAAGVPQVTYGAHGKGVQLSDAPVAKVQISPPSPSYEGQDPYTTASAISSPGTYDNPLPPNAPGLQNGNDRGSLRGKLTSPSTPELNQSAGHFPTRSYSAGPAPGETGSHVNTNGSGATPSANGTGGPSLPMGRKQSILQRVFSKGGKKRQRGLSMSAAKTPVF